MRTFLEYIEIKNFESTCAWHFGQVINEAENNPEFNKILTQEGFWSTLGNVGKAIGQFGKGLWNGGGIVPGSQAAWSQMTGPATQYKTALEALTKAQAAISKDPNWSKSTTTGSATLPAMPLVSWLKDTIQELNSQITQFQNKQLQGKQRAHTNTASPVPTVDPTTGAPFTPPVVNPSSKGHGPGP